MTLPHAVERKKPLQELTCFKSQKVNMIKTILFPCNWLWHQMVSAPLMPAVPSWFSSTCSGTGTFHLRSPLASCCWFSFKAVWSIPSQEEAETCN